jgi:alkanesulfonate monooxygenase SsuD/methylene tetrahydromethanopterin reductase-like flavin-dependent oxidoreductase (luciferase family)
MRSGLWLPLFEELAEPGVVARLAADAEERGWHGVFVWDQLRWREPIRRVADPWITLTAIAAATEQVRLGPMVTPLARRRPAKVARETASLDRLSDGRLILGVGLGGDRFAGEFSRTGEEVDDRVRGEMLDEALEILAAASTTSLMMCSSCLGRCNGRGYRCGPRRFRETSSRCAVLPVTTASSRSTSRTWISSRKPSQSCANCAATTRHRTISPSSCRQAAMSRRTPRPARLGG